MLRSFSNPPPFLHIPLWAARILTLVLPVWGAWTGALTIFQVIWVYWVEGWIVIPFLAIRIASARGAYKPGLVGTLREYTRSELATMEPGRTATAWERLKMIFWTAVVRGGLLLFYLLFIIAFILVQVTQESHKVTAIDTMRFGNDWANGIWAAFIFQHFISLLGQFFFNGAWRTASPRAYAGFLDRSTIIMHVMIVTTAVLHGFVFQDKPYAARGEVVYVALFALPRFAVDAVYSKVGKEQRPDTVPEV